MARLGLQFLPAEILHQIVLHLAPLPAPALSEYHASRPANPVAPAHKQDYHDRQKGLNSLCRTSKKFLYFARFRLYQHVSLYHHKQLYCLFRTMLLVPFLANKIKTIDSYIPLGEPKRSEPKASEKDGSEKEGSEKEGSEKEGSEKEGSEKGGSEPEGSEPETIEISPVGPNSIASVNPIPFSHFYQHIHPTRNIASVLRERIESVSLSPDLKLDQLPKPSCVIFPAVLALAPNLEALQIELQAADTSNPNACIEVPDCDAYITLLCASQKPAYFRQLRSLRFHRFNERAAAYHEGEIPIFIFRLAILRQVKSIDIAGLYEVELLPPNPGLPFDPVDRYSTLASLLTDFRTRTITRLELSFDNYTFYPDKSKLNFFLEGLKNTLQHLSVIYIGDTNSHRTLSLAGQLPNSNAIVGIDRLSSLKHLTSLTHLEVDLHSLFGWARIWSMENKNELANDYPSMLACQHLHDTIPKSLKSLHLIESWSDLQITLNHLAPEEITGTRGILNQDYLNHTLYKMGWVLNSQNIQDEYAVLKRARAKVMVDVLDDLVTMVKYKWLPDLKRFVFTPITFEAGLLEPEFEKHLVHVAKTLADLGVTMEIVYSGRLGRLCL